jgi:hypothetical protein
MAIIVSFVIVALLVCAISSVMLKLADVWVNSPLFYCNAVGKKLAICSIFDYCNAKNTVDKKKLVHDTLVFQFKQNKSVDVNQYMSGMYHPLHEGYWTTRGNFNPMVEQENLFVPFVSEGLMSFKKQEHFIMSPLIAVSDIDSFINRKHAEMLMSDWKLRLAWRYNQSPILYSIRMVSFVALVVALTTFFVATHMTTTLDDVLLLFGLDTDHRQVFMQNEEKIKSLIEFGVFSPRW